MSEIEVVFIIVQSVLLILWVEAQYLLKRTRERLFALEKAKSGPTKLTGEDKALIESQSRSIREIEAEWSSMYGKFDRTLKAMQARDRRDSQREPEEETREETVGPPGERTHQDLRRLMRRQ